MINPSFGYSRGFDRNIYRGNECDAETIENSIEKSRIHSLKDQLFPFLNY